MKIGIIGLGLIGGSMAKAYRAYAEENNSDFEIYATDADKMTLEYAQLSGVVNGKLDSDTIISECDIIFIALYPSQAVEYLKKLAPIVDKNCIIMDLCGTKRLVCDCGFALAKKYGFTFVGGHPMAGTQYSGYKYSRSNLFANAPMVIVPPRFDDIELFDKIKTLLSPVGFGKYSITSAEEHDKRIAFTSQLAHVVSNAYVKSPTAKEHDGFSAGSYKDLTRVAWLNENMWTDLFMENKDNLVFEVDCIIKSLEEYKTALENGDRDTMQKILRDGRLAKEAIDGK